MNNNPRYDTELVKHIKNYGYCYLGCKQVFVTRIYNKQFMDVDIFECEITFKEQPGADDLRVLTQHTYEMNHDCDVVVRGSCYLNHLSIRPFNSEVGEILFT